MATPFSKIYDYFLPQIDDYYLGLIEREEDLYDILEKYLMNGLLTLTTMAGDYNDIDLDKKQFNQDLELVDVLILAKAMKLSWTSEKKFSEENFTKSIGDRDFKAEQSHSLIKALSETENTLRRELRQDLMRRKYARPSFGG